MSGLALFEQKYCELCTEAREGLGFRATEAREVHLTIPVCFPTS